MSVFIITPFSKNAENVYVKSAQDVCSVLFYFATKIFEVNNNLDIEFAKYTNYTLHKN